MRHRRSRLDDEDEEDELEEEDEEEPPRAGRRRRSPSSRSPVRPWTAEEAAASDDEEEEEKVERGWFGQRKRPVYWRARDSLWFEPLVALAIVCLLIVGLWTYTQNWPPMYVVESDSMQHGTEDQRGLLNTGDLVLAQQVAADTVVTYEHGLATGYSTYGEYGDVILYHPDGATGATPIIHRPLVYLVHNPDASWSVPELAGLACSASAHPYYSISTTPNQCGTSHLAGTLTLYNVGWQAATVAIPLAQMGTQSGFVTMGDNNYLPGAPAQGRPDQTGGVSGLVQSSWIVGVARGMVPWFGALKLLFEGQASMVPSQSWQWIGIVLAGGVLLGLAVHLALRARPQEEDADEDGGGPGWGARLRGWFRRDEASDEEEDEEDRRDRPRRGQVRPLRKHDLLRRAHGRGGRPRPVVRRSSANGHRRKDRDERSL